MSSELKLDASNQILKSENKDLIFRINKNKSNSQKLDLTSECHIKIENISSNYVALRVRTTKKYSYAVYPIYAIIKPNYFINIKIVYHSNPNEVISSSGHKFRFEGFIIDEKEKNCKDILGLFQQYIKGKKVVKGNIIKKNVIFSFVEKKKKNLKEKKIEKEEEKEEIKKEEKKNKKEEKKNKKEEKKKDSKKEENKKKKNKEKNEEENLNKKNKNKKEIEIEEKEEKNKIKNKQSKKQTEQNKKDEKMLNKKRKSSK